MPTGFTACIAEGTEDITGNEFLKRCTRAFGIAVRMREDPLDVPTPEVFEPDTKYYDERLAEDTAELARITKLTDEEALAEITAAQEKHRQYCLAGIEKAIATRARYQKVLDGVMKWQPPTREHYELKNFAVKQLHESMDFDCNTRYYEDELKKLTEQSVEPNAVLQWKRRETERLTRSIEYDREHIRKEIENAASATKWMQAFLNSLPEED